MVGFFVYCFGYTDELRKELDKKIAHIPFVYIEYQRQGPFQITITTLEKVIGTFTDVDSVCNILRNSCSE
jgi:hypothetical protein